MYDFPKPQIPPALVPFMKKPPLVKGESAKEYYEFFEEVIAATQPEDMIDWLWTVRFTNGSWSVLRLTRFQAALLNGRYKLALHGVIRQTKIPVSTGSRVVQPNERGAESDTPDAGPRVLDLAQSGRDVRP